MDFRYQKTPEELQEAFLRQVGHLRRSIGLYDEGHVAEAERLASAIYVLLSDGGQNKSAAKLAGVKRHLRFADSSFPTEDRPDTIRIGPPLCIIGTDGTYWPRNHLPVNDTDSASYPRVPFSKWWKQVVYRTESGRDLSRMNLVFSMRNQDGGGHIDKALRDEAYQALQAYGDIRLGDLNGEHGAQFIIYIDPRYVATGEKKIVTTAYFKAGIARLATSTSAPPQDARPIRRAHWASMRQIAWEVDTALSEAGF